MHTAETILLSDRLGRLRKLPVFEVIRVNEFQHRIAEQKRILPVVEAPRHFVKVSHSMLGSDSPASPESDAFSQPREQLRQGDPQPFGHQIQVENRNIPLPPLHVGQETPVDPDFLGHYDLSPAAFLPKLPNSGSQANEQVGHELASWLVAPFRQI